MPTPITWLLPAALWRKPVPGNTIYLTFDDGPIPEVTPFVLHQLEEFNAQATFFCVGENLQRYPNLAKEVKERGHLLANHTFHHVPGWKTKTSLYIKEVDRCQAILETVTGKNELPLFRPPYGQLTWQQAKLLSKKYKIVMWSSLSYDFDASLPPAECLRKTISATENGSIIVMHDSLKAERNLRYVLPLLLKHFSNKGFAFKSLK